MATQQQDRNRSGTIELTDNARNYPSKLHAMLRITPQEVAADIRSRGLSSQSVSQQFDIMIQAVAAQFPPDTYEDDDFENVDDGLESLRFYEDTVAAGFPSGDGGDVPYRKARASDFFGHQDVSSMFVATVSGWSMKEDHIKDGDVVLVDPKAKPKDGDIVLACISGEGQMVKRLRIIDRDHLVLESANPTFKSIVINDPERLSIRGVVKGRAGKI
ncbi:LexA family transcriptional regulator [Paucibacter sp. KBW04]|uniref:LexA family protein n=1 Tax=Paucibacter sp. KBW04 TaxID=2153361 RepID=UPI0018CC72DF|nr:S24 family peptidase [Paucibacter sp. KBW04]